jgi:hypothetical protein
LIDGEGSDFFLRSAVQNEAFPVRGDAIDKAAAVRSGDQIAFRVEGEDADVGLVALEE